MNRIQNESCVCKCTENTRRNAWKCSIKHEYKQKNGWVQISIIKRICNKNGTSLVTIEPSPQQDGRSYNHLILIDWITGKSVKLTEGIFVVTKLLAYDEFLENFYFIGTKENHPGERHLYSVDTGSRKNVNCLTCDLRSVFFIILYFHYPHQ